MLRAYLIPIAEYLGENRVCRSTTSSPSPPIFVCEGVRGDDRKELEKAHASSSRGFFPGRKGKVRILLVCPF
ncbi:MAG: hypothetical protein PHQ81_06520 [Methanofollis sp.]|nr:hypothetical protein [Methanofollis sp.]